MLRGLIVTLALAALLFAYAAGAQLGGDEMFHLVWGADLLHGRTPNLESPVAPTMHPLELLVAVPAAALGRTGDDAMRIVVLLGLVATAVALYRIGTKLFSRAVGVLAAVLFVTRPHLLEMAHHGEPDVLAVAAVGWAAVVALEWPARRVLVLALLAVAGLFRPEAWLLALAYAAWQMRGAARREQVKLAALAVAGPVLWALTDLLLTGDPLLSFLRSATARCCSRVRPACRQRSTCCRTTSASYSDCRSCSSARSASWPRSGMPGDARYHPRRPPWRSAPPFSPSASPASRYSRATWSV